MILEKDLKLNIIHLLVPFTPPPLGIDMMLGSLADFNSLWSLWKRMWTLISTIYILQVPLPPPLPFGIFVIVERFKPKYNNHLQVPLPRSSPLPWVLTWCWKRIYTLILTISRYLCPQSLSPLLWYFQDNGEGFKPKYQLSPGTPPPLWDIVKMLERDLNLNLNHLQVPPSPS